jgi:hypothetical protein
LFFFDFLTYNKIGLAFCQMQTTVGDLTIALGDVVVKWMVGLLID